MKRELYLDGSIIHSVEDFHTQVKALFDLPHYYRSTLDDLWDFLSSYIDPNIRLFIHDYDHLIKVFGAEAEAFKEVFERLPNHCPQMEVVKN